MIALTIALSMHLAQSDLPPPPPPPPLPPAVEAPPPPVVIVQPRISASEREMTIRALREELEDLRDQKASIGFFWPVAFSVVGVAGLVFGLSVYSQGKSPGGSESLATAGTAISIAGAAIAGLSIFWFVYRITRSISLGSQIENKEEQLRAYEAQRLQPAY